MKASYAYGRPIVGYIRRDIPGNREKIEEFVSSSDQTVGTWFADTNGRDRANYTAMVDLIRKVKDGTLLAVTVSDLSRKVSEVVALLDLCRDRGWRVIVVQDQIDSASQAGTFMMMMASMFTEFQSQQRREPAPQDAEPVVRLSADRDPALADLEPGVVVLRHTVDRRGGLVIEIPCCADNVFWVAKFESARPTVACRLCGRAYAVRVYAEDDGGWGAELTVIQPITLTTTRRGRR